MNKRSWNTLYILAILWTITTFFICAGCGSLAEYAASDIQGWNLSACVSGFDTCLELYKDNESKFDNGFVSGMDDMSNRDN